MQYPNKYYAELGRRVISNPSLKMKAGEVCFYQEKATSFTTTTTSKSKPTGGKTSFFWTPWVMGIKRTGKTVTTTTETRQDYYSGTLFITNMRIVFQCKVDAFDLLITQIKSVKQYNNGIEVISGRTSYKVMTSDLKTVLHVIDLINKAQTSKEGPVEGLEYGVVSDVPGSKSEEELPFGWYTKNEAFIKPRDSHLFDLLNAVIHSKSIDEEKKNTKDYLAYFEEYKKECNSKGKYFKLYFEQMHMIYDEKKYSSPTQRYEDRLKEIEENYDVLIQEEIETRLALQTLDNDLMTAIKENPGILQSELVKQFPQCIKHEVTERLYVWAKEGKIKREKNGRSYSLYV